MRQAHYLNITIETANDAFEDCEHGEIARILRHLARQIGDGTLSLSMQAGQVCTDNEAAGDGRRLLDINGNTCGFLTVARRL